MPKVIGQQFPGASGMATAIQRRAGESSPYQFLSSWPLTRPHWLRLAQVAVVAVSYYSFARLGLSLALPPGQATAIWPPSGIALAAVLLVGYRVWPGIWLGSFLANIQDLADGSSGILPLTSAIVVAFSIGAGSTLQACLGASLITRLTMTRIPFDRTQDVFKFVGIETIVCVVAPTIGVTILCLAGFVSWSIYGNTWWTWWLGDLAGVIVFAPIALIWITQPGISWRPQRFAEACLLLAAVLAASLLIFWSPLAATLAHYPLALSLIAFLVWAAFRFGQRGVVVTIALISLIAILGTMEGNGPFARGTLNSSLLALQIYIGIIAVTGLVLATALLERERAENSLARRAEELARSNGELEQFAYVASHDLKEPLRMVTSYLQLLEKRYSAKLDADARDFIDFAVDGGTRMASLIDGLLAYSRVGTHGGTFQPTDCQAVLDRAIADLDAAIGDSGARVTHDRLPTVLADATQLQQVFQNLIANAIKFRDGRPPEVHVSAQRGKREWLLSVADNGIGIDPQYSERIFVVFQRLHGRREYDGTGIGLAICKKIIERHGGRIWFDSTPGKGSIFYFTLPERRGGDSK